jgi:hypothetical protein
VPVAAFKQDVLGAFVRIFIEAVSTRYRAISAQGCGDRSHHPSGEIRRQPQSHLHVAFLDGIFGRDEQRRVPFHPAPAPDTELQEIVRRVHKRATAWLR